MSQRRCKVYEARLDGKVVARGFADEVAEILGCGQQSIIWCGAHDGIADKKYQVSTVGWAVKKYDKSEPEIEPLGETFVERYYTLDYYGNTILTQEEYKRHQSLIEDKGYKVKYTKKKHGRQKAYYIVEVL